MQLCSWCRPTNTKSKWEKSKNLQYNCHNAKIVYNNDKNRDQIIFKISEFRALVIIYRAFLLEADVPDLGLDRFYLFLLKEREFSICLIVSGKEFQAIADLCWNERQPSSVLDLDITTVNDFLRL